MSKTCKLSADLLDFAKPGSVFYCREREGRHSVTTTARFMYKQERVVTNEDNGKEEVVTDYYLWDLRNAKIIQNPTTAWVNIAQYGALRSDGKLKLSGDSVVEDKRKEKFQKEKFHAVVEAA